MKTYSKLAIFAIFVIIICCLTTVSAADTNMTDEIAQTDTIDEDIVEASIDENVITTDENEEVIAEDAEPISDYEINVTIPDNMVACKKYEINVTVPEGLSGEILIYEDNNENQFGSIIYGENTVNTYSYTPLSMGEHSLKLIYEGNDLYDAKTLTVNFNISDYTLNLWSYRLQYADPIYIEILRPITFTETIIVTMNGRDRYEVNYDDYEGEFYFWAENLELGENTINLYTAGTEEFGEVNVTYTITTYNKIEPTFTITVPETITACEENEFIVTMNDDINDNIYRYYPEDDDWGESYNINDGTGVITITPNDLGTFTRTYRFEGDDKYKSKNYELTFTVNNYIIKVPERVEYDKEIPLTLTTPFGFEGDVIVTINGTQYNVLNTDYYTFYTDQLAFGDNNVNIYYEGDDTYPKINVTQTVNTYNKITPSITVIAPETIIANEYNTFIIKVNDDITDEWMYIENELIMDGPYIQDGETSISYRPNDIGNDYFYILYYGNEKYKKLNFTYNFNVTNYTIILAGDTYELSDSVYVELTAPYYFDGNITVTINGTQYTALKENYYGFYVNNLILGDNEVNIYYAGDEKYHEFNSTEILTTYEREEPYMNITGPETAAIGEIINIHMKMNEDIYDGYILLKNSNYETVDESYPYSGSAILSYTPTEEGHQKFYIYFSGNYKYAAKTVEYTLDVAGYVLKIPYNNQEYGTTEFYIQVPDSFEGNITVSVNGENYTATKDDDYIVCITNLNIGVNEVTLHSLGDSNYGESTTAQTIFIYAHIHMDTYLSWNTTEKITLDLPDDASGKLVLYYYDEENYEPISEIASSNMENGHAEIPLNILPIGYHYVYAAYENDDKYPDISSIAESIYIHPEITIPKLIPPDENLTVEVIGESTNGKINVYTSTNINEWDGGEDVEFTLYKTFDIQGEITEIDLSELERENCRIKVEYIVNDYNYAISRIVIFFNMETTLVNNSKVSPELHEYTVRFNSYVEGITYNYVDGEYVSQWTNGGNEGYLTFNGLTEGKHIVETRYVENTITYSLFYTLYVDPVSILIPDEFTANPDRYTTIMVYAPEDAEGTFTIYIDGEYYTTSDTYHSTQYFLNVNALSEGYHNITVVYSGDGTYNMTSESKTVYAKLKPGLKSSYLLYGKDILNITLPDPENSVVKIDESEYPLEINGKHGTSNTTGFSLGYHDIIIECNGSVVYYGNFIIYAIVNYDSQKEEFELILPEDTEGSLKVTIEKYNPETENYEPYASEEVPLENGKATYSIDSISEGSYNIKGEYSGNPDLNVYEYYGNLYVSKVKFDLDKYEMMADESALATVKLREGDGGNANLIIYRIVDNFYTNIIHTETKALENNEANFTISNISPGRYEIYLELEGVEGRSMYLEVKGYDPELNIKADEFTEGEKGYVTVTLADNIEGNVTLLIDGKKIGTFNASSSMNIPLNGLAPGAYAVEVIFNGDQLHYTDSAITGVNVKKAEAEPVNPTININETEADEGETATIKVELPEDAKGLVLVEVDGKKFYGEVENGIATVNMDGLKADNYTAVVTYTGDDKYVKTTVTSSVKVKEVAPEPLTTVTIDAKAADITEGETATININVDATGIVYIEIDGKKLYAEINDGKATITVDGLTAGEKTATITYPENDKYTNATGKATFKVNEAAVPEPINPTINITEPEADEGETATIKVELPEDAKGLVLVEVDGKKAFAEVENGIATVNIDGLTPGNHTAEITYTGDGKYNASTTTATVKVKETIPEPLAPVTIDAKAADITEGETATINIDIKATGIVYVEIDGKKLYAEINNGKATITVDGLTAGEKTATITYPENDKYASATGKATFKVNEKEEPVIEPLTPATIKADVKEADEGETTEITVEVPKDATGLVLVTVEDKKAYAEINNGKATVAIDGLKAGEHTAEITYTGDAKYNASTTTANVKVKEVTPEPLTTVTIDAKAADITEGETATINININATGIVYLEIDGKKLYAEINNGKATITVDGLTAGEKTATITYPENDKYASATGSAKFKVNAKPVVPEKETADAKVTVPNTASPGDEPVVTLELPKDAAGNASVNVDGKEVANVPIVNGTASVPLKDLSTGAHVVEVAYTGDDKYAPASETKAIGVSDKSTPAPAKTKKDTIIDVAKSFNRVANDYYANERGAFFYAVLKDIDGNPLVNKTVSIAVNGPIYNVTTDDEGRAGLQVNFMVANFYTYALSFQGDDDYNAAPMASSKLTITKKAMTITASSKTFKASAKKTISVTLKPAKNPYDGKEYLKKGKKVTLKVNGKTYTAKAKANGVAKFTIDLKKKGKYTAKINFAGDNTYSAAKKSIKLTIKQ